MSKVIGVIGLGSIGTRHARDLLEAGHTVRGYDTDMKCRLELNGVLWEMEELAETDALIIATPTKNHLADIAFAVNHKLPFLVEKPIAHGSIDGLRGLLSLSDKPVMVGNNLRFHPCVIQTEKWLEERHIGTPLWGSFSVAQYTDKPPYLRDGVTLNWGAHEIDLACHLLGWEARVVTAAIDNSDAVADICLSHSGNGARSRIHLDYVTRPQRRGFTIVGRAGHISVDLEERTAIARFSSGDVDSVSFGGSFDDDYKSEMQAFIELVDGKCGRGATAENGIKTLELILEAKAKAVPW